MKTLKLYSLLATVLIAVLALSAFQTTVTGAGTSTPALSYLSQPFRDGTDVFLVNAEKICGFNLPYAVTASKLFLSVSTADAVNNYSFGIFDSTGARVANTAAATLPATGNVNLNLAATVTLQPGKYYFGMTTNCAATCAVLNTTNTGVPTFFNAATSGNATAGGAQPATITVPGDTWVVGQLEYFALHQ